MLTSSQSAIAVLPRTGFLPRQFQTPAIPSAGDAVVGQCVNPGDAFDNDDVGPFLLELRLVYER